MIKALSINLNLLKLQFLEYENEVGLQVLQKISNFANSENQFLFLSLNIDKTVFFKQLIHFESEFCGNITTA